MNTKLIITLFTTLMVALSLTACGLLNDKGWGGLTGTGKRGNGFKNARGGKVFTCKGNPIAAHEGSSYLKNYGLPREIGVTLSAMATPPNCPKTVKVVKFVVRRS